MYNITISYLKCFTVLEWNKIKSFSPIQHETNHFFQCSFLSSLKMFQMRNSYKSLQTAMLTQWRQWRKCQRQPTVVLCKEYQKDILRIFYFTFFFYLSLILLSSDKKRRNTNKNKNKFWVKLRNIRMSQRKNLNCGLRL